MELFRAHVVPKVFANLETCMIYCRYPACVSNSMDSGTKTTEEESPVFEVAIVCTLPEKGGSVQHSEKGEDPIQRLVSVLRKAGLIVEEVEGVSGDLFLKIAAPAEVIGRTAEKLQLRKPTFIGLDAVFDWGRQDAFVRQPHDNALFSWSERYECYDTLLHSAANESPTRILLRSPSGEDVLDIQPGEALLPRLQAANVVKEIFPLHDTDDHGWCNVESDEKARKQLLDAWSYNWLGLTSQPIDEIYAYLGAKIATYFAFLGMYTQWLFVPAILGIIVYYKDLGAWEPYLPPLFSIFVVIWAVLFLQFWKRKNAELLTRWGMSSDDGSRIEQRGYNRHDKGKLLKGEIREPQVFEANITEFENRLLERNEWLEQLKSVRNNAIVVLGILCLQLPFELAYAHISKITTYNALRYGLTVVYVLAIQLFTKIGGKVAMKLSKTQHYNTETAKSDGLVYKVFGIYFMQSYIGLFYHALFHRDFKVLRRILAERLIVSELINNVTENLVPYLTYRYNKYKAFKGQQDDKRESGEKNDRQFSSKLQEEFLKPPYAASICDEWEDGLFDDFLELALQFGMVTMFASAFPLVSALALANNLMEIRSDSFKLLAIIRRPVPHVAASIGAWLNIFQHLGVVAIVTNCALLICLYDEVGRWKIEPGLAAIVIMEHVMLLAKFGFSWFVPEEPAWVKAKRVRRHRVQDCFSLEMLSKLEVSKRDKALQI